MNLPERYVVDTSALYAVVSADDRFHDTARGAYERLMDRNVELWITSYALSETVALVHRRLGFDVLSRLLEIIESNVSVYWIEETLHSAAMEEFKTASGRGLSLVDWTIVLAARMLSARVFTFDAGMADHGVAVAPGL